MIFNSISQKRSQKAHWSLIVLLLLGNAALAQFSGDFAPANWTTVLSNSNGSVNTAGAPASVVVIGSNNGSGFSGFTEFRITAPSHGIVTASWAYHTNDVDGPAFDLAFYNTHGVLTQLSNNAGPANQSGTLAFSVLAGQVFGFRQSTGDNVFGNATLTISNFVFTDISCGKNGDKINICHKPGEQNAKTLCIGLDGLADHIGHGDYVGPCGSPITASPLTGPRPGDEFITEPVAIRLRADVFTNPSSTYFTIKLQGDVTNSVKLRVIDATGREVELRQNLVAGETLQIGQNYVPGMYIAEIVQGNQRRTIKLVKTE